MCVLNCSAVKRMGTVRGEIRGLFHRSPGCGSVHPKDAFTAMYCTTVSLFLFLIHVAKISRSTGTGDGPQ